MGHRKNRARQSVGASSQKAGLPEILKVTAEEVCARRAQPTTRTGGGKRVCPPYFHQSFFERSATRAHFREPKISQKFIAPRKFANRTLVPCRSPSRCNSGALDLSVPRFSSKELNSRTATGARVIEPTPRPTFWPQNPKRHVRTLQSSFNRQWTQMFIPKIVRSYQSSLMARSVNFQF